MAEWKLANGEVLSDTDFDIEAETWENDAWAGKLEGVRVGRRPLCDEPLKQINVKLPESWLRPSTFGQPIALTSSGRR